MKIFSLNPQKKLLGKCLCLRDGGVRYVQIPNRGLEGVRYMRVPNKGLGFCGCYWPTKKIQREEKKFSDDCEEFFKGGKDTKSNQHKV